MPFPHSERHLIHRIGWLRAAVLGANDGIVSTASLVIGVAAADASRGDVLVAGVAGLVAGALSMAAGEYVSVSSQADTEAADLARERHELATDDPHERAELSAIYVARGLEPPLARPLLVAQLHQRDATRGQHPAEVGQVVPAGHLRIDNRVAAQVDAHQRTFALDISVARSSA